MKEKNKKIVKKNIDKMCAKSLMRFHYVIHCVCISYTYYCNTYFDD